MEEVLALRPFVPSKDYEASKAFYAALGFTEDYSDANITSFNAGAFSFFLQNLYVEQFAENCMLQLVVRNLDAWWAAREWEGLEAKFGMKTPIAPARQAWGSRVGFVYDPCGVLWHVTESAIPTDT